MPLSLGSAGGHPGPLEGQAFDLNLTGDGIRRASAFKVAYAGLTKGLNALPVNQLLAAEGFGFLDAYCDELAFSQADLLNRAERFLPYLPTDAGCWIAETHEIGDAVSALGLTRGFSAGAADKHAISRARRALGLLRGLFNGRVGWHEVYMTVHVLVNGERMTLGVVALKRGVGDREAVGILLREVKRYAPDLRFVLGDKEFCKTLVINEIKAAGMKFLDAHPQNKKTDKLILELERTGRRRIAVPAIMKSKETGETTDYWLIGTLSRKARDGEWRPEDGPRAKYVFYAASSYDMNVSLYAKRWGIETAYRMDESIRAKTASRSHGVRVFFFLFTVAVYNMQVVLNVVHTGPGERRHMTLQTVVMLLHDEACIILSVPKSLQDTPDSGGGGEGGDPAAPADVAACEQR